MFPSAGRAPASARPKPHPPRTQGRSLGHCKEAPAPRKLPAPWKLPSLDPTGSTLQIPGAAPEVTQGRAFHFVERQSC